MKYFLKLIRTKNLIIILMTMVGVAFYLIRSNYYQKVDFDFFDYSLLIFSTMIIAAAGNENNDACKTSPASVKEIFTVMASDRDDNRAWFSNWGKCADIYSPGVDITSTIPKGKTATYSGTSMACPALVGVLNHYLDQHPELNMKALKEKVLSDSSKDKIIGDKKRTNNYLIFLNRTT